MKHTRKYLERKHRLLSKFACWHPRITLVVFMFTSRGSLSKEGPYKCSHSTVQRSVVLLQHTRLGGGALEVGDEVVPLSRLLEPSEHHLGSRMYFGVLQVGEKGVFSPLDALVDVGLRIRVSLSLAGLTTEEAVQVGALLMSTSSLDGVTLGALS